MADDEYELIPHKDIIDLKEELGRLKGKPSRATGSIDNSIDELNKKLSHMILLFNEASRQVAQEDAEEEQMMKRVARLEGKVDMISEQNEKIAEAILSIADMIGEQEKHSPSPSQPEPQVSRPFESNLPPFGSDIGMPPPRQQQPQRQAPPSMNRSNVPPPISLGGSPQQRPGFPGQMPPPFTRERPPFDNIPPPPVTPQRNEDNKKGGGFFSRFK